MHLKSDLHSPLYKYKLARSVNVTNIPSVTQCTPSVNTCSKPDIENGEVSPNTDTVDFQSTYTVDCIDGYTVSTEGAMTCQANNTLDIVHTCIGKYRK